MSFQIQLFQCLPVRQNFKLGSDAHPEEQKILDHIYKARVQGLIAISKDALCFFNPSEWSDLYNSPGLAEFENENESIKPRILIVDRYHFEIININSPTLEKIETLMKNFKLPDDVKCQVNALTEEGALIELISNSSHRKDGSLSVARKYDTYYAESFGNYHPRDPRYIIDFTKQ